ncbi:MAG: DUF736 domain-containing protein [Sphingorhabdus sp.]|jgi:uncharacterized protein (DUF736 family)|uniref:DUF736 family protein n=1 Tax=Sphingorhabdus sp. TaxID=1902408 RepID=UPI0025FE9B26|nr:DUF736 family protein [Sphingorhabdus sp.]MCO4091546.1 DUF736 domain-containing protein [Sphingorhabdus sp.]
MSNMQQLGIVRRNANNGTVMGRFVSLEISLVVALRAVSSDNPDAPKYEVHGLNKSANEWVQIGAVWEKFSNSDGSAFLQGSIKDRSFGQIQLLGFPRQNNETGEDEIVFGIPANRRRSNAPMDAADDGLGNSTEGEAAASPKGRKAKTEQEVEAPAL